MPVVVVGYVPKPEGEAAVLRAAEEAVRRGARLVVVSSQRDGETDPAWIEKTAADLDAARLRLDGTGCDYEIRQTVAGEDPADDLVAAAEETGAELVVIGIRRRSSVGKLILGTQAQRILLDAPCPVLAVKPD